MLDTVLDKLDSSFQIRSIHYVVFYLISRLNVHISNIACLSQYFFSLFLFQNYCSIYDNVEVLFVKFFSHRAILYLLYEATVLIRQLFRFTRLLNPFSATGNHRSMNVQGCVLPAFPVLTQRCNLFFQVSSNVTNYSQYYTISFCFVQLSVSRRLSSLLRREQNNNPPSRYQVLSRIRILPRVNKNISKVSFISVLSIRPRARKTISLEYISMRVEG